MNYCALDDAFQAIGAPSPGCTNDYATRSARKEERRKARRCKGISEQKDPDRLPAKVPSVVSMNPATGLREYTPNEVEPFLPRNDDDYTGDLVRAELPFNIPGTTEAQKPCPGRKKFFGADPDEPFADYLPDVSDYRLQPDFLSAFEYAGVAKAGSTLPKPSSNMYWKPLTAAGETSFTDRNTPSTDYRLDTNDIMKKLDKLWARLDDMNTTSPEQVTSELLMFISSGIFVLFMMDLLVKKGSTLRF